MNEFEAKLESKNVSIETDQKAREWLGKNGYDILMGARPMARLIQERIKRPLAEELLFGNLSNGGHVCISVSNNELTLKIAESVS